MTTPTILAATPVISSRQWSTALSPRSGGGWKFITQSYNYPYAEPTQWVLINIEEGVVSLTNAVNEVFSNTNFQVPSVNTLVVSNNQIRAASGRIFFPEIATPTDQTQLNMLYYDPADEAVHQLPAIAAPVGQPQAIIFQAVFGHAGDEIWCGTQAQITHKPYVFSIDPVTLVVTPITLVGVAGSSNPRYAYYLAKDEGPGADFLYVAVGQDPWELVSIDLTTNTPTVLLTTTGPGFQFIEFEPRAEGWDASVTSNGVQTKYWIADGAITPYPGGGAPPGGARTITPYVNALVAPPQIDWSRGIEHFLWRPNGSTGPWTEISYEVDFKGPINLESMTTQSDGIVVGNAEQYNGFFQYRAVSHESTWFGNWPSGVSSTVLCNIDDETVYICGYPNGTTYRYNPGETWAPDGAITGNPAFIGNFGTTCRYPYFLVHCEDNNRIYTAARQERDSLGSGVGYYDIDADTFFTVDDDLDEMVPRGFVVLEDVQRVVYSGSLLPGALAPEAQLVVYDYELTEITRWTVIAGLQNTGILCATHQPNIIVGLTTTAPITLYRFNIETGTLLDSVALGAVTVGGYAVRPADGSLWVELSQDLVRIDVETLERTTIVDLEISTTIFSWLGSKLFMVSGAELRYLATGGAMANVFQPIPAPAGNGTGAAVDFSGFGPSKTIVVSHPSSGPWAVDPVITIEINNDDVPLGSWAPLKTFKGSGIAQVDSACQWMRASVANYQGGGAPVVNVGGTDEGVVMAELVAPSGNGVGAAVDVSGLGLFKTIWVGNDFTGTLNLEVSTDAAGTYWGTIASFNANAGQKNVTCAAKWMRARRSGVIGGAPTAPLIAVGGVPV